MHNFNDAVLFFGFWVEISFLGQFGPKNLNCHLKLKFGTYTSSNMQNSMVMFIFFAFDRKYPFWANSVQNIKILTLSWNLVHTPIRTCRIQWLCSIFFVFEWKYPFWANLFQKIKIVILCWNLVSTLIGTCRIQWWCSFFLFLIWYTLFGQIWSKKSKLLVEAEIW